MEEVVSGTVSQAHAIALTDVVNGRSIPFSYRVENDSAWIEKLVQVNIRRQRSMLRET